MGAVTASAAALVTAAMVALWVVSVRLRDASVVDVFWGPAFALVAWTGVAVAGPSPRALLAAALASAWGLRLGLHLARRRRGAGEDRRYAAMRAAHGARFPLVSLFTVFLLQAGLLVVVSLPLQAAAAAPAEPLGAVDAGAVLVFGTGLAFEAVADAQLARFLAEPGGAFGVMDRGLWRFTRHPNYFGDFLVWCGLGLLGVAAGAPWTLAGPAVMTVLLVRVSGVRLLEATIGTRRPGYAEYVARTSAFVPRPPRRTPRAP